MHEHALSFSIVNSNRRTLGVYRSQTFCERVIPRRSVYSSCKSHKPKKAVCRLPTLASIGYAQKKRNVTVWDEKFNIAQFRYVGLFNIQTLPLVGLMEPKTTMQYDARRLNVFLCKPPCVCRASDRHVNFSDLGRYWAAISPKARAAGRLIPKVRRIFVKICKTSGFRASDGATWWRGKTLPHYLKSQSITVDHTLISRGVTQLQSFFFKPTVTKKRMTKNKANRKTHFVLPCPGGRSWPANLVASIE